MSIRVRRSDVNNVRENHLLTSLITNGDFCRELLPILHEDYLINPYSKIIFKWVNDYYNQYSEPPNKMIQNIFSIEKGKLDDEDCNLIEIYLSRLSESFESGFNEEYSIKQAETYIRERSLAVHCDRVGNYIKLGRLEEAEQEQANFKKISKVVSDCIDPNDESTVEKYFKKKDDGHLMKLPGALGDLFGPLKSGWMIVLQGGYKVSKSWNLLGFANVAMKNRLKVLHVNLEMNDEEILDRYYRSISGLPNEAMPCIMPYFDCERNQIGTCNKKERTNHVLLYNKNDRTDTMKDVPGYKPCVYCRDKEDLMYEYDQTIFYRSVDKYGLTENKIKKKVSAIKRVYGDCVRMKRYDRGMGTVQDIRRHLDILEYTSGWIPQVITVDYAQILGAESKRFGTEEEKVNASFEALAALATERNCLIITASQIKTADLGKKKIKAGAGSQSARGVNAHCWILSSLTPGDDTDKYQSICISVNFHRSKQCNENIQIKVLQSLDIGSVFHDTAYLQEDGD